MVMQKLAVELIASLVSLSLTNLVTSYFGSQSLNLSRCNQRGNQRGNCCSGGYELKKC